MRLFIGVTTEIGDYTPCKGSGNSKVGKNQKVNPQGSAKNEICLEIKHRCLDAADFIT